MFPLIINTLPENGADNIPLDSLIKVMFDGKVDPASVNTTNIKLLNYTTGEEVVGADIVTTDADTAIVITPPNTATGGHRYEGLTEYRLQISGLETPYGEEMFGTFEMRFTTIGGSVEEVISDPGAYMSFEVIMTYPKENSVTAPAKIKVKCSDNIDPATDKSGIILMEDGMVESIDEAIFVGENLLDETMITIVGDVVEITPPELESGKKYAVIISNITSEGQDTVIPHMFSFYTVFPVFYGSVSEIRIIGGIGSILEGLSDYEVALKIFENSRLARFISEEAETLLEIDWAGPAYFVTKYVETKTKYDFLFNKVIEMSSGPTSKQLKDLLIEYGYSLSDLLALVDKLKLEYLMWEDYLKGHTNRGQAKPGTFIKGEQADEVPDYKNRQLKDWEGQKSW